MWNASHLGTEEHTMKTLNTMFDESELDTPARGRPQTSGSPRTYLWGKLEALHDQLGLPASTASLTIEDLQAEVDRR